MLAAQASESSGDWAGATKYWGSLLERNPDNERYAVGFGDGLRHTGRYDEAVQVLLEARNRHPGSAAVVASLGKAQLAAGRREEAIVSLTEASAMSPGDWSAQSALAVAYGMTGQEELADQHFRQALALAPGNPVVLNNYGLHLAITGRLEEGLVVMEDAVGALGAPSQVRQNLALLLAIDGRMDEAEQIVRAELPRDTADLQMAFLRTLSKSDLVNLDELVEQSALTIDEATLPAPTTGRVAALTNLNAVEGDFLAEQPLAVLGAADAGTIEVLALETGQTAAEVEDNLAVATEPETGDALPTPPAEPADLETAIIAAPEGTTPTPAQESAAVTATLADLLNGEQPADDMAVAPPPEPGVAPETETEDSVAVIVAPAPEPEPDPVVVAMVPETSDADTTGEAVVEEAVVAEAVAATATGPWRVQIASLPTEALAQRGRDDLLAAHPGVLGGVEVEVVEAALDDGGTTWRVYAGRFADRASAIGVCEALRATGGDCLVAKVE